MRINKNSFPIFKDAGTPLKTYNETIRIHSAMVDYLPTGYFSDPKI